MSVYEPPTNETVCGSPVSMKTPAKKSKLTRKAFEMVLAEIRDGRTLLSACADEGLPERADVLRHISNSEEAEAKMLQARRIGVWMQMDRIHEQLSIAKASQLPMLKEQANHVRWLAGKFGTSAPNLDTKSTKDVIEVRWLEDSDVPKASSKKTALEK